jgi:hypothetical protein
MRIGIGAAATAALCGTGIEPAVIGGLLAVGALTLALSRALEGLPDPAPGSQDDASGLQDTPVR